MKRYILFLSSFVFSISAFGQNEVDALRYSNLNPFGTARFAALGGAMGALGGDVTTMVFNPAGTAVYRSNTMVFTPAWTNTTIESEYRSSESYSRVRNNIHMSNIGFVSANEVEDEYGFKFVNFGFAYNQLANFNQDFYISGQNNFSSFLDPQVDILKQDSESYNVFYETYLVDDPNGEFINPYTNNGYGTYQTKLVQSSGYAGEYTFNVSTNILDRIYAGLSLGIMHITYTEQYNYSETPNNNSELLYFDTKNQFTTRGNGLNLKVGLIGRVNQWLRLGAALHTPTLFNMRDNFEEHAYSQFDAIDLEDSYSASLYVDNIKYNLSTPVRAMFSAAFIYKKLGLISIDYEYVDYTSMNLQSSNYDYVDANSQIKFLYKPASNIKIGGEYTMGPLAARLGFALYGSAFDSDTKNENADTYVYSGGIGFRSSEFFVDFTAKYSLRNEYHFLYDSPNDSYAELAFSQMSYLLSIGFKF